jgi:hypothetical protein
MHLTAADRSPAFSWARWALVLLIAVSFAVRLHDLGAKSLWSDEGLTLRRAEQPLPLIFKNLNLIPIDPNYYDGSDEEGTVIASPDLHPPLYFLMMHLWIGVAGRSEFALRFPSVVAATLTLPLLYALARRLLSAEAGLWAALLGALSPFYLWYAQEARMYTWIVVLSLASVYALVRLLGGKPRRRDYAVYGLVTLALLYTHYSGFFLLAFEVIVYGVRRLRRRASTVLIVLGAIVVALVPLIPYIWRTFQLRGLFAFGYTPLHTLLAEAWSSFNLGLRIPVIQPLWRTAPFLLVFAVGVVTLFLSRRREAGLICLGYFLLPILFLYALSLVRPSYMNPRHLMVASPAWELVLAQGLVTLRRRFKPGLVLGLGCVLALRGWADYDIFTSHNMWKDDIRGAVQYIEERARPGDAIVLHHNVIRLTFDYYYDGPYPQIVIPRYDRAQDMPVFHEQARETFAAWAQQYDRIWFLYGPPPTFFPHDYLPDWADANLFKVDQQSFEAWWTYVGVAAYDDGPPLFGALPDGVEPLDVAWDGLRLVGFAAPEAAAGENARLTFYWRAEGDLPDEPLTLAVKLRDEAGDLWLERTEQVLPFYPQSSWPEGQIVMTDFRLPLPEDTPPVDFTVEVGPVSLEETAAGQMSVIRPATRAPAPRPQARFAGGLELLSSELAGRKFRAGQPLLGSLSWRAAATPAGDYGLRVRLIDLLGREVTAGEMAPSAAGFPTGDWLPDDRVAGRLALSLPADLPGGTYRVQIGLVDADGAAVAVRRWYGGSDWFTVGTVRAEAWPLVTRLPGDVDHLLEDVRLGEAIRLRGYDLARDENPLTLTLYWQADAPPGANYHVFVHLVKALDAPPVAQADGVPADWQRPTTTWRTGEVIVDTHTVSLADVEPGRYSLVVGMYDPEAGGRPATSVDGEVIPGGYVPLREIQVER